MALPAGFEVTFPPEDTGDRRMTADKRRLSPLNIVAFCLLVVTVILCGISFFSPYWIRLSLAWYELRVIGVYSLILNPAPAWIGLLGSCDTTLRCQPTVSYNQYNTGSKGWYRAAGVLMGIGFVLHLIAFLIQCLFTCYCKCFPVSPRRLTVAVFISLFVGCVFCISALSVFGHNCFTDGLMDPLDLNGPGGKLDWGFFAGIGGVVIGLFTSLFFALDACQQGRKSSSRGAVPAKKAPPPYTDTECASLSENTSYPTKDKSQSPV